MRFRPIPVFAAERRAAVHLRALRWWRVFAMISSLVQLIAPDEMRGRVMSVYNVAFRGGMPIGSLISGQLIGGSSVGAVLAINGIALAILGLYFLLVQRRVAHL